ncbi:MAG: hypothetical protein AB1791_10390, partial [Chloroflexota bacterium]
MNHSKRQPALRILLITFVLLCVVSLIVAVVVASGHDGGRVCTEEPYPYPGYPAGCYGYMPVVRGDGFFLPTATPT